MDDPRLGPKMGRDMVYAPRGLPTPSGGPQFFWGTDTFNVPQLLMIFATRRLSLSIPCAAHVEPILSRRLKDYRWFWGKIW